MIGAGGVFYGADECKFPYGCRTKGISRRNLPENGNEPHNGNYNLEKKMEDYKAGRLNLVEHELIEE